MDSCYIEPYDESGEPKSRDSILTIIENYAKLNYPVQPIPSDARIFGYGYDQACRVLSELGGEYYTRQVLDGIGSGSYENVPIYIAESSLHEAWVNTKTLTTAGINLESGASDPVTGIVRDNNGNATGILINEAVTYVLRKGFGYPILDKVGYQNVVKKTSSYLNKMGYTGHYDAWTNFDGTEEIYDALSTVDKANNLTCFYTASYNNPTIEYKAESLDTILDRVVNIRNKYKSTRVDPKFIKLFADGVLETGTGFLKEPYTAVYEGCGEKIWDDDDMNKIVSEANKRGLLVHTHTLGDASCAEAVQSFVNSNKVNGKKFRNSLGHCILVDDSEYALIKDNGIGTALNAGWLTPRADSFDLYNTIIGEERAKKLYPGDLLMHDGIQVAISTDRPCASGPIDVFDYMASIILGYDANLPHQTPRREINLSVQDAINMLTINGAWMAGYENERGSIEVGKYADFLFSDYSPFDCDPKIIKDIEVATTCFEGKFVYIR
ncbi:MAG: amidohydrolase family protein [Bacilli bacterium]|nr:amidohydrolase family protein [Bacilli bacterium]